MPPVGPYLKDLHQLRRDGSVDDYFIRLLKPNGIHKRIVYYELEVFRLRQTPAFAALSYSWGTRSATAVVALKVGNFYWDLAISPDLESALERMQTSNTYGWLWVDAICIDQANSSEKSDQVSIMRRIFGRASCVYVWLGEQTQNSSSDLDRGKFRKSTLRGLLPAVKRDLKRKAEGGESTYGATHSTPAESSLRRVGLSQAKVLELIHQRDRLWWHRLWVIQEIASCSNILVCIGANVTPWDQFVAVFTEQPDALRTMDLSSASTLSITITDLNPDLRIAIQELQTLHTLRDTLRAKAAGEDILELLRTTSATGVSLPPDRVYSLLGLATAQAQDDIAVDYAAPLYKVFASVLRHVVCRTRSLDVLVEQWPRGGGIRCSDVVEFSTSERDLEDPVRYWSLPTWTLDFLSPLRISPQPLATKLPSSASTSSKQCFDIDGCQLNLAVIRLDTVDTYKRFERNFKTSRAYSYFNKWSQSAPPISHQITARGKLVPPFPMEKALEAASAWLGDDLHDGGIFCTKLGFFGVCLANLRPGDHVVVAAGASVPFVLRKIGIFLEHDRPLYVLIGECFVKGVMHGELVSLAARADEQWEKVTLV